MKMIWVLLIGSVAFSLVTSCSWPLPHENFKSFMKSNVGKKTDDPSSDVARYPETLIGSEVLANGNAEYEYQFVADCSSFFEIEKETNKIVGWRFEGSEADCVIVP